MSHVPVDSISRPLYRLTLMAKDQSRREIIIIITIIIIIYAQNISFLKRTQSYVTECSNKRFKLVVQNISSIVGT